VKILSIGEVLWDIFGESEMLGGAPLNFSAAAKRLGNSVALLSAVGDDVRGAHTLERIDRLGVISEFVQKVTDRPTGTAIVSTDSNGNPVFTIDRPAAFDCLKLDESLLARIAQLKPDWIYFGTLAHAKANREADLLRLVEMFPNARCIYDVNLRAGHWTLALVERLSAIADVIKLNKYEAEHLYALTCGNAGFSLENFCRRWVSTYQVATICVTLGSEGCAIFADDALYTFRGFTVEVVDTVGAGDAFAASLLHGLHRGWPLEQCATLANAAGAIVASRAGANPTWTIDECLRLIEFRRFACETDVNS
jgi:fructokinase